MNQPVITSAALFYREIGKSVPLPWFEHVLQLFGEFGLQPLMFSAEGGPFKVDDCYLLDGSDDVSHRTPIPTRSARPQLVRALGANEITTLSLDAPRIDATSRSEWLATASASAVDNEVYLGMDEKFIHSPSAMLRRSYEISKGLYDLRYGFAYNMPLRDCPDCYATGVTQNTDIGVWLKNAHDSLRPRTSDERWAGELGSQNRHLHGYFRDVYPANLLSSEHVQAARLLAEPLGILERLDGERWIWELSQDEITVAHARLHQDGLLIEQLSE